MNNIREIKQQEATDAIVQNKYSGLVHISPRVGKSKIAIDAINNINNPINILIIAPKLPILKSWKTEIKKWKLNSKHTVELIWSNSIKKLKGKSYHLIICDEIHEYNEKVLLELTKRQFSGSRLLGLSGTLSEEKESEITKILKLKKLYEYSFEEAIKDGIIADYEIICVGCDLDTQDAYIKAGNDKNQFMQTEKAAYSYWDNRYKNIEVNREFALRKAIISKRKTVIYESKTKINKTLDLVNQFDRCLIFTGLQDIADTVGEKSYHSKSKEDTLEMFMDGKINKLAVVSMISMGITIPNLKVAIFNQVKSNEALFIQQALRTMNLEDNRIASIYIVYLKGTQDEVWLKSAINGFDKSKIKFI